MLDYDVIIIHEDKNSSAALIGKQQNVGGDKQRSISSYYWL